MAVILDTRSSTTTSPSMGLDQILSTAFTIATVALLMIASAAIHASGFYLIEYARQSYYRKRWNQLPKLRNEPEIQKAYGLIWGFTLFTMCMIVFAAQGKMPFGQAVLSGIVAAWTAVVMIVFGVGLLVFTGITIVKFGRVVHEGLSGKRRNRGGEGDKGYAAVGNEDLEGSEMMGGEGRLAKGDERV